MYYVIKNILTFEYSIVESSTIELLVNSVICSMLLSYDDCEELINEYNRVNNRNNESYNRLNNLYQIR